MNHSDHFDLIGSAICNKPKGLSAEDCFKRPGCIRGICRNYHKCRIWEKSTEQLGYVAYDYQENSFLEACAGSGKTEVVGLKAAYEIQKWESRYSGIAILTFTNSAADVIQERIIQTTKFGYPHFVGTFDSWLHRYIGHPFAHLITKYKGKDRDRSIKIVEDISDADFLVNFRTKYQYADIGHIQANEFFFNMADNSFIFSSSNDSFDRIRNKMILEEWGKEDLSQTKDRFWEKGFATYQDVEYICHEILKRDYAAEVISKRFPFIIVDECQDLAWSQIQILEKLLAKGSKIHLVGDLNQAIYSFRKVDPKDVKAFVSAHNFTQLRLTENFRSLQPIVDLSAKLVGQFYVKGQEYLEKNSVCLLIEYKKSEIHELPKLFIEYLVKNNFEVEKCAILTRNNNTVAKLRASIKTDLKMPMLPPAAIQIWGFKDLTPDQTLEALSAIGKFVAIYHFGSQSNNRQNQYCPNEIKSNIRWRLFLAHILDMSRLDNTMSNLELDWATWAKHFRKNFHTILATSAQKYEIKLDTNNIKEYIAPMGAKKKSLSKEKVALSLEMATKNPVPKIRITNFHQIKGETLDVVMVVSSPTNQGKGEGYWKKWLENPESENARFAYVASTRPRHLLIWAVPEKLTQKDFEQLTQTGLTKINTL